MNLFELQERLKDFSQDQLVREMQAPTGTAPQFLVLSELQRRQRMMAEEQAQMQTPQTTVAEDAIAAAGVPQGGLADMARSMAPQTDMDMNTATQPVERMRNGGVVRMRPGGLARSTGDPELDAALAELERQRLRQAEVLRSLGLQGDEEGLSEVSADVGSYRPSPISAAPMTSSGGLPNIRETQNLLGRIRPSLARQLLDQGAPPSTKDSVDAVRRRLALMDAREDEGPYTEALRSDIERQRRRLTPDDYQSLGETDPLDPRSPSYVPPFDASEDYDDFDYQRALDEAARMRELNDIPFSSGSLADVAPIDAREDEGQYTEALRSDIERQRRRLTPADYQSRGETDPLDPRSPSYVPPLDTSGAYANLLGEPSTIEAMFGDVGPLQGPMQPEPRLPASVEDKARMMELNAIPFAGGEYVPPPTSASLGFGGSGFDIENLTEEQREEYNSLTPEQQENVRLYGVPGPRPSDPTFGGATAAIEDALGPDPLPAPSMTIPEAIRAYEEFEQRGPKLQDILSGRVAAEREAAREAEAARMMEINEIPATARKVTDEGKIISSPQPKKDTDSGGTGGGAGASAPAGDDAFEQDKWLALAQAGLALMSSQQPTIGGAIGEAGLSGITALRQARTDRDDRIERQQARADRLAAAARKDAPGYEDDAVGDLLKQRELLEEEASRYFDSELGAVRPGYEERYNRIFQRIDLIDSAVGAATISRFPGLIEALTEE
jgi:hypothetical protein